MCQGMQGMTYIGTNQRTGDHLFRCPGEGCHLKDRKGVLYCREEVWEQPLENPRIVGILPRASPLWKRLYKLRWHVERLFRSVKHSRLLETHCFRGWKKNILHATLSMLTYSATVLAHLQAGNKKFGRMRVKVQDGISPG